MIYIKKTGAPRLFQDVKRKYKYYSKDIPETKPMREYLIKEQGYLCAYCMRRIELSNSSIEHYIPQSVDKEKSLNYHNLLAVCCGNLGKDEKSKTILTCDKNKDDDRNKNKQITINPTNESHMRAISYKRSTGEILSSNDKHKMNLDVILNLNHEYLKFNRKKALKIFKDRLDKKHPNMNWSNDKDKIEALLSELKSSGIKDEYVGIIIWYFEKRIHK